MKGRGAGEGELPALQLQSKRQALYLTEKHNMNHHMLQSFTIIDALKSATNLYLIP